MGQVTAAITDNAEVARKKDTMLRGDVPTVFLVLCVFLVHGELDNIHTQHKLF